ncbi:3997_t:CDS:2 [Funneliformis geosporum]|uniref:3997_t:CDS:1 n=1 Tax=Funneliformis geosporum TaxID=1117311 RepID=A0A9W4T4A1_9GLOM|nr:3997_t:CDS:2 [Funneliformis geosporum]
MAERVDYEIRGAFQNGGGNDTFRPYMKNSIPRQVSTDTNYYDLGCLESPLELCPSAFKEDNSKEANRISIRESETLNREYHDNTAGYIFASINSEPHVLRSSIETERKRCKIHDGCVNSVSTTSEREGNSNKERERADVKVGKGCEECPNQRTMDQMQAQFGKLCRIGYLGGNAWKTTAPQETCRFVHPHSRFTQKGTSITESPTTMSQVQLREGKNESSSCCNNPFILVDTFEDKSRIATLINCEVLDSDPKELVYYIKSVAEFGFNHIITIGETDSGIIFLDCFGRVFQWDDESVKLWPLGNTPEEVAKHPIVGEDQLGWFVMNGIVYEYFRKWEDVY